MITASIQGLNMRIKKYLRQSLALLELILFTAAAQAQDTNVQTLERNLQERDMVITELLERVESLERRIGVHRETLDVTDPPTIKSDLAQNSDRAPGVVLVEEGAAERALERSLTRAGALLLPAGVLEVEPSFTYVRQEDISPSFVTSGG